MFPSTAVAEEILRTASTAVRSGDASLLAVIDCLPVAIYAVDCDGYITYFNASCPAFAGRKPVLGRDRWCVSWKLFTEAGVYLPHAECPVVTALRDKRVVRGVTAVAERPDGSRFSFMPFPTPLIRADGALLGVINLLIDLSVQQQEFCERLYSEDLSPWYGMVVARALASCSIAEVRGLVDEMEREEAIGRPRVLN